MMLPAEAAEPGKILPAPGTTNRVLRVAEDQQGGKGIGQLLFQILKVHRIPAVPVCKRILQHGTSVALDAIEEVVIYRRLDDHFFPGDGEYTDGCGDGRDHACHKKQFFPANLKAMMRPPPVPVGIVPCFRKGTVSEYTVNGPFFNGAPDTGGRGKIHIRHPHGQFAVEYVPFFRTGPAPVRDGVEIICHVFRTSLIAGIQAEPSSRW